MTADSILNPPETCTCDSPRVGIDNGRVYFKCGGCLVDGNLTGCQTMEGWELIDRIVTK